MLDIIRWTALIGGAIILGLHIAVYKNADRLTFHPKSWRIFIAGNSIFTTYALIRLLSEQDGLTIYIVFTAMMITLAGIIILDHTYRLQKAKEAKNGNRRRAARPRSVKH